MDKKTKVNKHKDKIAELNERPVSLGKEGDSKLEPVNPVNSGKEGDSKCKPVNYVNLGKDGDPKTFDKEDEDITIRMELPPEMAEQIDRRSLQALAEGTLGFLQTILGVKQDEQLPAPTYDQDTGQYFLGDEVYQEDDIAWMPLLPTPEQAAEFESLNADELLYRPQTFDVQLVPESLAEAYQKARFEAFGKDEPGYVIICRHGEFWLPCQNFLNPHTHEIDQIICVYNAEPCLPMHRHFYATVDVEIGNLGFQTNLRFRRGAEVDWGKRFWDEVDVIRRGLPTYDPFLDPYDPKNIYDNSGWQFFFGG